MAVQQETYLQRAIQKLVKSRGGYIVKQHGSMISEPGIPDLLCCYKGFFIAIECKEEGNKPSAQQGIHCRAIQKAGGITVVTWDTKTINKLLDYIDYCEIEANNKYGTWQHEDDILFTNIQILDNGSNY